MNRNTRSSLPRVRYVVKFVNGVHAVFDTHSYRTIATRDIKADAEGYAAHLNKKG